MNKNLDYVEIAPSSGSKPNSLVVFLHGYGANSEDLISLAQFFQDAMPDAHFISPNAPHPCGMGGGGYQWFSLTDRSLESMQNGVKSALVQLDNFIMSACTRLGIPDGNVILIGFSQGTMMSLSYAMQENNNKIKAVIGFSGMLIPGTFAEENVNNKIKVLLVHGEDDDVVDHHATITAAVLLRSQDIEIEHHILPGLPHSIDMQGVELAKTFLANLEG
jgi:phospholipase/carboxylesterase